MSTVDVQALESVLVGVPDREILELESALPAAPFGGGLEALGRLISEEPPWALRRRRSAQGRALYAALS